MNRGLGAASVGPAAGAVMAVRWWTRHKKLFRVVVLALPILAAFTTVVCCIAFALAWVRDLPVTDGGNLTLAIVCGLIAGLFFTVFHVKPVTLVVLVRNPQGFLTTCQAVLHELGYEVHLKSPTELASRPSFRAFLAGGAIEVEVAGTHGRISGPKVFVEIVCLLVRLHSHIKSYEQGLRDGRVRHGDRLLKRVQLSMRVTPEQWQELGDSVIKMLAGDGAEVVCEVHLLAQSGEGIRESMIEGPLRDWLRRAQIAVQIHKDHVRWDEPVPRLKLDPITEFDTSLDIAPVD